MLSIFAVISFIALYISTFYIHRWDEKSIKFTIYMILSFLYISFFFPLMLVLMAQCYCISEIENLGCIYPDHVYISSSIDDINSVENYQFELEDIMTNIDIPLYVFAPQYIEGTIGIVPDAFKIINNGVTSMNNNPGNNPNQGYSITTGKYDDLYSNNPSSSRAPRVPIDRDSSSQIEVRAGRRAGNDNPLGTQGAITKEVKDLLNNRLSREIIIDSVKPLTRESGNIPECSHPAFQEEWMKAYQRKLSSFLNQGRSYVIADRDAVRAAHEFNTRLLSAESDVKHIARIEHNKKLDSLIPAGLDPFMRYTINNPEYHRLKSQLYHDTTLIVKVEGRTIFIEYDNEGNALSTYVIDLWT